MKDYKYVNNELQHSKFRIKDIALIALILIFIFYTSRGVRLNIDKIVSTILFMILIPLMAFYRPTTFFGTVIRPKYLFGFAFLILTSMYFLVAGNTYSYLTYNRHFLMLFGLVFIGDYILRVNNERITKIIFWGIICTYLYLSINTLVLLKVDPMLSRKLAAGDVSDELASLGIGGGFGLAYALTLLVPSLVYLIKNKAFIQKYKKGLIVLFLAVFIYTIIKSNYGMAFVFMIVGSFLSWILSTNQRYLYLKIPIFILIICFLLVFKDEVISGSINFILSYLDNSSVLALRLMDLRDLLLFNSRSANTEARIYFYGLSLDTFINNPFIGKYLYILESKMNPASYIGGHSEFFDMLAKYGLISTIPMFGFLVYQIKDVYNRYKKIGYIIPYLMFFIISWLNLMNVFIIYVVIGVFVPISSRLLNDSKVSSKAMKTDL